MPHPDFDTMSRPLAVNNTGDMEALALKQFSGEVLASYDRTSVLEGKILLRNITNGKEAQFPLTGRASAEYHIAGQYIEPDAIKSAERTISIDGLMIAKHFVPDFDEKIKHFETRSIMADELGKALGFANDQHTIMNLIRASHSTKVINDADQADGQWITNNDMRVCTGGASDVNVQAKAIADSIFMASQILDENFVTEEKFCILRPAEYYALVQGVQTNGWSAIHKDYDGAGSYSKGQIVEIGGVKIVMCPTIPKTNITQSGDATGLNYFHYGDYSKLIGCVFTKSAIGQLRLMGMSLESEWDMHRQGHFVLAKQACGFGVLRPECSVALELDTVTNQTA